MKNWHVHGLNIIVLVAISVFGLLALFGNAMSAVSSPSINFAVYTSFLWWGIFYGIQFLMQNNIWRVTWFLISLIVLWFWISGGGASFWNMMFE
ncbi:hypothetical protein [Salinicoccus sp. RF5]|uniref:hypothetical protein n=1 Tax=Salinicoccus TaxID=45669 RepID=UPI001E490B73|nr:hypothetical protein [Salinicoccus sp. RF5]MCC4721849.1 hypothetical protein [Salinicoccus sp. RF5]